MEARRHSLTSNTSASPESKGLEPRVQDEEAQGAERMLQQWPLIRDKTPEERRLLNRRVVRKLDFIFLPCITAMLLMNYLDRINVSNARLAGMQRDLNMSSAQWSAGISTFYVGYIVSQVPANVVLARGNPRVLLPCTMLAWSAVAMCMMAVTTGWGFILSRFLVGVTEGPFIPAVSLMTSSWYTKEESPLRMSIWHAGSIVSNVVSGLLAAAVLTNLDNVGGLSPWQWFMLMEGMASVAVGISAFWLIPKWPNNTGTYFFTPEESEMAQYRQQVSAGGITEDDVGGRWDGVLLAVKDPFTWMFSAVHCFVIIGQSFKDFLPSILHTFAFTKLETYLLQAPPYIFAFIACVLVSWSSGRFVEHCWHMVGSVLVAVVGSVILITTLDTTLRYFSLFLLCSGPFIALNLQISWETTVVPRPRTKRAALLAIANSASCVTNWFTPYCFLADQAPRYQTGGGVIIVGCGLAALSCPVVRWWCMRKNKALEKREAETGEHNSWRFVT
ncbi:major facilitator superfamily transporter [Xylariomycetidae sp. FL2044]|nr:major facilitator superfamily transporter [Xylariomycetidae sp. FL2044]